MKQQLLKFGLFFLLIFCATQPLFAQTDSSIVKSDSINAKVLNDFNEKNIALEKKRTEDSLKSLRLEAQLNALKTTDNLKKQALLKQLDSLKAKDYDRIANKKATIDSLRLTVKSFPVTGFFNDTLFSIYSKLASFSAKDRAENIDKKIKKIASNFRFTKDSLTVVTSENTVDVMMGDVIIVSVSENDAIWNNTTKYDLAEKYKTIIGDAIVEYKHETSLITLLKEIGLAILVLIIVGFVIFYLLKLFRWTHNKIELQEGKFLKGIKLKDYTLLDAKREVRFAQLINKFVKWFLIIIFIYIALPILFGIFPWTENLAQTLFGYVLNPLKQIALGFWNYLPNLITIIVIVIVFRYVVKGFAFFKNEIENKNLKIDGFYPDWANPTYQIIRILIFAFMIIVIFPYLPGSDSKVFQGVSVFLGFLFTFGSAGSLSNVMAGLVLTYMRLFKIGDRVKIGDVTGDIIEKSLLVTRIRTVKNEIISIPNSTVLNSHTINYSSAAVDNGLILHTTVTIGYDVPWKDMHQALINAADRTDLILKEPKPFVLQTSLEDFYVSYQINAYTKDANKQAAIYSQLHSNIQDCCNEVGIEILSPHYRAARDGNRTTIPENYLDKDYKAPSFNINNTNKNE